MNPGDRRLCFGEENDGKKKKEKEDEMNEDDKLEIKLY